METFTGNHYTNARLNEHLKTFKIKNFESIEEKQISQIFCATCDDFFAHEISIPSFSAICEALYLPSLEKKCDADLIGTLDLAQDLNYQYKHDKSYFFVHLRTIMEFYLQCKSKKTQQV